MDSDELYSIREWAPLTDLIDRIPTSIQHGLFPPYLNLTCIDAVEQFIALGSDAGIIFWYDRQTGEMQKLKAESGARITCVKIADSVEFLVAAGDSSGRLYVFAIQKQPPPDLQLVAPCTKSKPVERYFIKDLHKSPISCCEWSKNSMKLYSGNRAGVVVLSEFDYQKHISKSKEILNEAYEIVQLSVHRGNLLVSTLYRTIVCDVTLNSNNCKVTQIGKKDRKELVDCGGMFFKHSPLLSNTSKPRLICGRPNLRFWLADIGGTVEKTLIFHNATGSPTWEIPILNPKISPKNPSVSPNSAAISPKTSTEKDRPSVGESRYFREIYSYAKNDDLIVTRDETAIYVLNLDALTVEAAAKGLRKIIDFCVYNKEIFVLEGERSLLRLAPMPEKPNKTAKIIYNPALPPPLPNLGPSLCGTFEAPLECEPENQPITNADKCPDIPPIEASNAAQIPIALAVESSKAEQTRRLEIFDEISATAFDENILHHSGILNKNTRKKKKSKNHPIELNKQKGIVEIGHAAVHDERMLENTTSTVTDPILDTSISESILINKIKDASKDYQLETREKENTAAEALDLPQVSSKPISGELCPSQNLSRSPVPELPKHVSSLAINIGANAQMSNQNLIPAKLQPVADHSPSLKKRAVKKHKITDHSTKMIKKVSQKAQDEKKLQPQRTKSEHIEKKTEFITLSAKMDASFCLNNSEESGSDSTMIRNKHHPSAEENTAAEALNVSKASLEPISGNTPLVPETSHQVSSLYTVYPTENVFKDTGVQTTPKKKIYYIEEETVTDFIDGRPIEDICHTLRATHLLEADNVASCYRAEREDQAKTNEPQENNFVIDSFLPDFERAGDPLNTSGVNKNVPPESTESSSNEWEFLDYNHI